jgi:RTX toxin RtxA
MPINPLQNRPYDAYSGSEQTQERAPQRRHFALSAQHDLKPRSALQGTNKQEGGENASSAASTSGHAPASPGVLSRLSEVATQFQPRKPLPGTSRNARAPNDAHRALIGQTIAPATAEQFMDKIRFDGTGRIKGFKKTLAATALQALDSARIPSLTQTRSDAPREAPRTERECLMHLLDATRNAADPIVAALHGHARRFWLEGIVNTQHAAAFFQSSHRVLAHMPALQDLAAQLIRETQTPKTHPQYHDAIYARKFESVIARELVNDPPEGVLRLSQRLNAEVQTYLDGLSSTDRAKVVKDVAKLVRKDVRPWHALKPAVDSFIKHPSTKTLVEALGKGEDGLDVLNSVGLAHHVWVSGYRRDIGPPWMAKTQSHYRQVVKVSNSDMASPIEVNTNGYGARLVHHPAQTTFSEFGQGSHRTYTRRPDMEMPTPFEDNLLSNGHVSSAGASGLTNVLVHTALDIERRDASVSRGDAAVAMVMLVGMNGGHSIHEVMATNASIPSDNADLAYEYLAAFNAPYRALGDLAASPGDKKKIQQVLDGALDETLAYFESLSVQDRR